LERIAAQPLDRRAFTIGCRSGFLNLTGAVVRGEKSWMTADQILAAAVDRDQTLKSPNRGSLEDPQLEGSVGRSAAGTALVLSCS
jgi:hypothetical protein